MKADERFRDVVGVSQSKDQSCCSVEHGLETVETFTWKRTGRDSNLRSFGL